MHIFGVLLLAGALTLSGYAKEKNFHPWNLKNLYSKPDVFEAPPSLKSDGLQALFYSGEPWRGNDTITVVPTKRQ